MRARRRTRRRRRIDELSLRPQKAAATAEAPSNSHPLLTFLSSSLPMPPSAAPTRPFVTTITLPPDSRRAAIRAARRPPDFFAWRNHRALARPVANYTEGAAPPRNTGAARKRCRRQTLHPPAARTPRRRTIRIAPRTTPGPHERKRVMRYAKARVTAHGATPCLPRTSAGFRTLCLLSAGCGAVFAALIAGGAHAS